MKKLIEYTDGWRWAEGNTSSAPFEKDSDQYTSLIEEGCEVIPLPQDKKDEFNQSLINSESLAYLASTDWYVTRKSETGKEVPQDILVKRQEARDSIK